MLSLTQVELQLSTNIDFIESVSHILDFVSFLKEHYSISMSFAKSASVDIRKAQKRAAQHNKTLRFAQKKIIYNHHCGISVIFFIAFIHFQSFVHSFFHSFFRSFLHSFFHSFIHTFTRITRNIIIPSYKQLVVYIISYISNPTHIRLKVANKINYKL